MFDEISHILWLFKFFHVLLVDLIQPLLSYALSSFLGHFALAYLLLQLFLNVIEWVTNFELALAFGNFPYLDFSFFFSFGLFSLNVFYFSNILDRCV